MDNSLWKPPSIQTVEDRLLFKYWQEVSGVIITEVTVGGRGVNNTWPKGSKPRRIDAVRVLPDSLIESSPGIFSYSKIGQDKFNEYVSGSDVEVIEIKRRLGRYVIGQVIIGVDLLELAYQPAHISPVIICQTGDPLLEMLCDRRGIKVWKVRTSDR